MNKTIKKLAVDEFQRVLGLQFEISEDDDEHFILTAFSATGLDLGKLRIILSGKKYVCGSFGGMFIISQISQLAEKIISELNGE